MSWILPTTPPKVRWKTRKVVRIDPGDLDRKRTKKWRRSKKGKAWYAANRQRKIQYLRDYRKKEKQKCNDARPAITT